MWLARNRYAHPLVVRAQRRDRYMTREKDINVRCVEAQMCVKGGEIWCMRLRYFQVVEGVSTRTRRSG